jgi:CheY-like chemotaxis protein
MFIGSSTESLTVAYAVQANLGHLDQATKVTVWSQGLFKLSETILDGLLRAINKFDFAMFVFTPDDVVKIRNTTYSSARDNIIFELGLFIARIGKERTFIVTPVDSDNLRFPTDLIGITPGTFDSQRIDELDAALGPVCYKIAQTIKNLGPIPNRNDQLSSPAISRRPQQPGQQELFDSSQKNRRNSLRRSDDDNSNHILIVDDDSNYRKGLRQILEEAGYKVSEASTNKKALELVFSSKLEFSLVITDSYRRPEQSGESGYVGLDLIKTINAGLSELPVILISNGNPQSLKSRAPDLQIRALLDKKQSDAEIGSIVRRVLNGEHFNPWSS